MYKPLHLIYCGKTKDTYSVKDHPELLIIRFKNNVLGKNGKPDSGGNEVIATLSGKGRSCAAITRFFFKLFEKNGIDTHFVKLISKTEMVVKKTVRIPVEFICRNYAYGSYLERHPKVKRLKPFKGLIEYSLKSDEAGDPFISLDMVLKFITKKELKKIQKITAKVNRIAGGFLGKAGIRLIDFKLEFGRRSYESWESSPAKLAKRGRIHNRLILIDDFSTDTARLIGTDSI